MTVGAECLVFTTGPAGPLTWEDAADALESALAPGARRGAAPRAIPFALEHTNSLRVDVGFVHTLRDVVDLARRLDIGVCMEINACWAERGLGGDDRRRRRPDPARAGERLRGRHALARRTGSCPATATSRSPASSARCSTPATTGCFDLELIGPAIEAEGYARARPACGRARSTSCSRARA